LLLSVDRSQIIIPDIKPGTVPVSFKITSWNDSGTSTDMVYKRAELKTGCIKNWLNRILLI
jgi:hypothetical protein